MVPKQRGRVMMVVSKGRGRVIVMVSKEGQSDGPQRKRQGDGPQRKGKVMVSKDFV